jgi:TrmH family RNA methyltransferase
MLLIEGVRLVGEALQAGHQLVTIVAADDEQGADAARHLADLASLPPCEWVRVPRREFARLTDTVHAAGIAALLRWQPSPLTGGRGSRAADQRVLICDHLADPGNLGTLIRAAAGLGVDRIIITPDSVELTNPKTVRATAGALFRLPIHENVPATEAAAWCQERQLPILIADAHRGHPPDTKRTMPRWALVLGGETIPHNPIWSTLATARVHLPLRHGVESLNVAVAGAILIDRLGRERP